MRLTPALFSLLAAGIVAGCLGPSPREATWAEYDLGSPRAALRAPSVPLAGLEVRAAPWLDTTAQLYRLRYADDFRRHRFAASRWAAPPAELLERFLQREILFAQADAGAAGCRLSIALDEFEQRFETQAISDMVLEARAQLVAPRGETVLAKQVFQIRHPATSPDAQSGVAAARAAVENLVEGLDRWLAELSRSRPAVMAACKRTEKK